MGTPNGKKDFAAFKSKMPELRKLAKETSKRTLTGIAAYKPANRSGVRDNKFFNLLGMTGVPLDPCNEFPTDAPAACFTGYVLADNKNSERINRYIATGRPTLISGYLAEKWSGKLNLSARNVMILPTEESPWQLLEMTEEELDALRTFALKPFKINCKGPNRINMVLFTDGSYVLSNFHDEEINVTIGDEVSAVAARGGVAEWKK